LCLGTRGGRRRDTIRQFIQNVRNTCTLKGAFVRKKSNACPLEMAWM
jgi:hypothetical protein